MTDKIKTETWVAWVGACVLATCSFVVFAYANFETKEHAKEVRGALSEDLHRLENKIDALADQPPTWPELQRRPSRR